MQGSTPSIFVGTAAFEIIVKQQIKRLEEPSLKCCQLVYDELTRILSQLLAKIVRTLRFARQPELTVYHSNRSSATPLCANG